MVTNKRPVRVAFGPPIPAVPYRDFSKLTHTKTEWAQLWSICGPSVKENMNNDLPLWMIITAAYMEGLLHGYGLAQEKNAPIPGVSNEGDVGD